MTTSRALRANDLRVNGAKLRAAIGEVVTDISLNYPTDAVAELAVSFVDPSGRFSRADLGDVGTTVTMVGNENRWRVGSVETAYGAADAWTLRCRSTLAQGLRKTFRTKAEVKVSPTEWVTRQVKAAGGACVAQKSNKRIAIGQAGGDDKQSVLDVIGSLASELEWRWVEVDGTFIFGDDYWAWEGGAGTPTWRVTWKDDPRTDAMELTASVSDDDLEIGGAIDLSLPNAYGRQIRPWHRIILRGTAYDGTWLVETVDIVEDQITPVRVTAVLPYKPRKRKGSGE